MISTLRQLQEKAVEQQRSLCIVIMDFSKAFDTVNRWTLWKVIKAYGCPELFINMIRQFHDGMTGRVSTGGDISNAFPINHGVNQGCVLAPTVFTLPWGSAGNNVCKPSQWHLHLNTLRWEAIQLGMLEGRNQNQYIVCQRAALCRWHSFSCHWHSRNCESISLTCNHVWSENQHHKNRIDVPTTPHQQPQSKEHRCVNKCWGLEVYKQFHISGKCSDPHQLIWSQDWEACTVCIQSIWFLTKMPVVTSWCKTVHKNQGTQHCHTPSLVILNSDNDSVPMSLKTTHKDPTVTFASYNG